MLTRVFVEEEVKAIVWDCEGNKCPGPDGFNFHFIKARWDIMKANVLRVLRKSYCNYVLPKGTNATFIALIPKKDNPQGLSKFRPTFSYWAIYIRSWPRYCSRG